MSIYYDNSATTKTFDKVNDKILNVLSDNFGNPSSLHDMGLKAELILKEQREIIAKTIGASPDEIYFTSCGTEGNNIGITGYLTKNKRKGNTIITDSVEHASVSAQFRHLKEEGYNVKIINVTKKGIDYDELSNMIDSDTALVSIMHVNNETGMIFDIKKVKDIINKKNKDTILHCDCVQSYLKVPFKIKDLGADIITASSHKINGPKGAGFIYIKKGILVNPIMYGGGQEKGLRSGTENVPAICGMGTAAKIHFDCQDEILDNMLKIKTYLYEGLKDLPGVVINTDMKNSAPHILNVSFKGVRSEIMLHTLEQFGIMVSSGSACSSNNLKKVKILEAMGEDVDIYDSAIRFSFGAFNDILEAKEALKIIEREYMTLRKRLRIK